VNATMGFTNRISQTLHEEHRSTVALVERLEQLLARHRRTGAPDIGEPGLARLLQELSTGVEAEVQRHFDFEETRLFPILQASGDEAIAAHLTDEHQAIRPIGASLAKLARGAADRGFEQGTWDEFRGLGQELCERMLAHVQKEEMALLPMLEDNMDADTEARLLDEYLQSA
jgi:hemerythrin-like domain-containing protein